MCPSRYTLFACMYAQMSRKHGRGGVHCTLIMLWLQDLLFTYAMLQPAAAWAVQTPLDSPVVQDSISKTPSQNSLLGWVLLFSPLLAYGLFTLYRERINPKAKLSNFSFVLAGLAILGNIISIVVFKIRWF